jgi:hypothetical protein
MFTLSVPAARAFGARCPAAVGGRVRAWPQRARSVRHAPHGGPSDPTRRSAQVPSGRRHDPLVCSPRCSCTESRRGLRDPSRRVLERSTANGADQPQARHDRGRVALDARGGKRATADVQGWIRDGVIMRKRRFTIKAANYFSHDNSVQNWTKSSLSNANGNCVQVAGLSGELIQVRDSKNVKGPVLRFTPDEWDAFVGGVRNGEFDRR